MMLASLSDRDVLRLLRLVKRGRMHEHPAFYFAFWPGDWEVA